MDTDFQCILCGTEDRPAIVAPVVKGDASGKLRAVQCLACSHVQLSPPSYDLGLYEADGQIGFVISHYGTPIEKIFEHSAIEAKRRIARFADHGETLTRPGGAGVRLLDIGGGYGFFGAALTAMRPDVSTRILEPSQSRAETGAGYFNQRNDPDFHAPCFDVRLLDDEFVDANRASFDVVTLWHVLEHVEDPTTLMRNAVSLLRPGGTLWVEVPNVEDELAALSPAYKARSFMHEHISYFSGAVLDRMARRVAPQATIGVHGYQRYGIFNYFNWIHTNAPQGANPDLFERDRWWLESTWRLAREASRNSDTLLLTIRLPE